MASPRGVVRWDRPFRTGNKRASGAALDNYFHSVVGIGGSCPAPLIDAFPQHLVEVVPRHVVDDVVQQPAAEPRCNQCDAVGPDLPGTVGRRHWFGPTTLPRRPNPLGYALRQQMVIDDADLLATPQVQECPHRCRLPHRTGIDGPAVALTIAPARSSCNTSDRTTLLRHITVDLAGYSMGPGTISRGNQPIPPLDMVDY